MVLTPSCQVMRAMGIAKETPTLESAYLDSSSPIVEKEKEKPEIDKKKVDAIFSKETEVQSFVSTNKNNSLKIADSLPQEYGFESDEIVTKRLASNLSRQSTI